MDFSEDNRIDRWILVLRGANFEAEASNLKKAFDKYRSLSLKDGVSEGALFIAFEQLQAALKGKSETELKIMGAAQVDAGDIYEEVKKAISDEEEKYKDINENQRIVYRQQFVASEM